MVITAARIDTEDGTTAALIEWVPVGGGDRPVGVLDGETVYRQDPASTVYHVRFLSPDRMIPDELRTVDSFEEAVALAEKYAAKLAEHAKRIDELAEDLKV